MRSSDDVADQLLAATQDLYDRMRLEFGDVPEEVFGRAQGALAARTKAIPGPGPEELTAAREQGLDAPVSPPERWVGWAALALAGALKYARRPQ